MTIALLEGSPFGLGRLVGCARKEGHRLRLLTRDRGVYRHELSALPADALDVIDVDTFDVDATRAALSDVPDLAGLINSTDTWSRVGARMAAQLGLAAPDPDVIDLVRDKARVRNLLHTRGLSRATAVEVIPDEIRFERFTLPAIIRDIEGTGGQNVWIVRDEDDLRVAVREARRAGLYGRLLAELYLAGPVYSAETLSWQGRTRLLGVSSRQMSPLPRFREEVTAFPVAFPPAQLSTLEQWVGEILGALGFTDGLAHTELALTSAGPEVIEVNPRLGGALVGETLCRALGYDVYRAMIDLALGQRPELIDAWLPGGPASAFVLCYPEMPGKLSEIRGLDRLADHPGPPEWYPAKTIGDEITHLRDSRGYAGIVLAEAETAELAMHRAVAAAGSVQVVTV